MELTDVGIDAVVALAKQKQTKWCLVPKILFKFNVNTRVGLTHVHMPEIEPRLATVACTDPDEIGREHTKSLLFRTKFPDERGWVCEPQNSKFGQISGFRPSSWAT